MSSDGRRTTDIHVSIMSYPTEGSISGENGDSSPFLLSDGSSKDPKRVCNYDEGSDPTSDSGNPREWPLSYKRGIVALLAGSAFTVYGHPIHDSFIFGPWLG